MLRSDGQGRGLEQEGQRLVERLGGHWRPEGGMCRCPAHDDRTPSLSVRPGRTRLLLHCFVGCEPSAILHALDREGLLERAAGTGNAECGSANAKERCNRAALRLWAEARPVEGTPAAAYLAARGVRSASSELRYHVRAPCGRSPLTEFRPALIAAVRDESGLVAVHRTFIDPGGRRLAAMVHPRRGLGHFRGGAVRLGGICRRLGLAEGIETALSATALFGVPCWAALGAERLRFIVLPSEVRELLLFVDHDAGGRRAERLARDAFGHRLHIEVHCPPGAGEDWNDMLLGSLRPRNGSQARPTNMKAAAPAMQANAPA